MTSRTVLSRLTGGTAARPSQKAFTLIELLVVIAVIAVLMGIMMPALSKVRKQGFSLVCKTNLKSYGTAGIMYIGDNDNKFPNSFTWLHADGAKALIDSCAWHDATYLADGTLWPYLKSEDVHMCPMFKRLAKSMGCEDPDHDERIPVDPQYSYSMNCYLGDGSFSVAKKVTNVRNSSEVLFFSEENPWVIEGLSTYVLNNNNLYLFPIDERIPDENERGIQLFNNIATYHKTQGSNLDSGIANIVFVDGHVGTGKADNGYHLAIPQGMKPNIEP